MQKTAAVMTAGSGLHGGLIQSRPATATYVGGVRMPVLPQAMRKPMPRIHRTSVAAEQHQEQHKKQPQKVQVCNSSGCF
jgi:hypothetical protein